jgi:hypothetical protein
MPPESKKKSTDKPIKKVVIRKGNLFFFKGKKKTKEMYKYGFMYPKKLILLNTKT